MFFTESSQKPPKHTIKEIRHDHLLTFSEESLFEGTDRTYSKVHVELPYPIHKPFKTSEDLVHKLLEEKANYNNMQESIRKRYTRYDKKDIVREKKGDHQYINLPKYLINWYDEKDPDPTFNSDYNYYYTNGNLEHFQYMNHDYLIRPDLDNNLCITNTLSKVDMVNEVNKINYSTESPLYNINSIHTNDGLYFVLREKYKVSLVKLRKKFKMTLKYSKEQKEPLLDAKLSADGKLGLISANTKFIIKDIETDNTIISFKSELSQEMDTFQQFKFLEENSILLMDRKKIRLIDVRTKSEEVRFEPKLLKCNYFYNFNTVDNMLITSSRHYLLKTDLRNINTDEIYHYSHSLNEAPCYLDYTKKDSDTYLTISGQNCDSRVLYTGNAPYSIPFKIPSIKRTLIESRLKYPSLVLEHHLDNQLFYSVTGLKILNLDGKINIFTSNCFGEIYKQRVFDTEPNKLKPIEIFKEWAETIVKPEPKLYLTHFEEISDIRFSLNKPLVKKKLKKYESPGKEKDFLNSFSKRYSSKNVNSQLAKDFISIWEDSDESDEEIGGLPQEEPLEKVNHWIQTHHFTEN